MREFITEVFTDYNRIIIFLHVISAVLLIGCLFIIRFFVVPVLNNIKEEEVRYKAYLELLRYFFFFVAVVMSIVIIVSVFMNIGFGFKFGDQTTYIMIHVKEIIWTMMAFNFLVMYSKYRKAKKAMESEMFVEVHENLVLIVKYLIPANLLLGATSVYFGIIIRGY